MGMKNRWIALYVENQVGVLAKVSGLFSAKCYNLQSLTVGTTEENLKAVFEMRADQKALSPRELDVLRLASKGYRNNEIARLAGISVNTLKYHLKNAFDKLGVTSRTEAVTEAIHRGIIES